MRISEPSPCLSAPHVTVWKSARRKFINRADQCLYAAKKGGRNMVKCETDTDIGFDAAVAYSEMKAY